MNILLDFIPFQHIGGVSGAASFTKAVTDEVIRHRPVGTHLFAVYDSTLPVTGRYHCHEMAEHNNIKLIDIRQATLADIVSHHAIDVFFMAIAQLYKHYNLNGIRCKTVMFIHDIFDAERADNYVDATIHDTGLESRWSRCKRLVNIFSGRSQRLARQCYASLMPLYTAPKTVPYTVSDYSRHALCYHFPAIKKEIKVCYSPLRQVTRNHTIENPQLQEIVRSGKRYLLMVSANRLYKNPHTLAKVFKRLNDEQPDLHLLTLKMGRKISPQHTDIAFLSDSDLCYAYEHALALVFPSYFEGFGYPPVEAMEYGTPVVASNVTSIPEILGDAAFYFSPFYPADLYRALHEVLDHPDVKIDKMRRRLAEIHQRQDDDLKQLINDLLTP